MTSKWLRPSLMVLFAIIVGAFGLAAWRLNFKIPKYWEALNVFAVNDTVSIQNGGSGQNAILFAQAGSFPLTCQPTQDDCMGTPQPAGTVFSIRNLIVPPGEVAAFGDGRPPSLKSSIQWTTGSDPVDITFPNEYAIDAYVWMVFTDASLNCQSPFPSPTGIYCQEANALEAQSRTNQIWSNEKQGIYLNIFEISDHTADTDQWLSDLTNQYEASGFTGFSCEGSISRLAANNRFHVNALNIYYVPSVSSEDVGDGVGSGFAAFCTGSPGDNSNITVYAIVTGYDASPDLLAHEIGHAFSLTHVNNTFPESNVMCPISPPGDRQFLTEGQTFRSIVNYGSAINDTAVYHLGSSTLHCDGPQSDQCPVLELRIWPDNLSGNACTN